MAKRVVHFQRTRPNAFGGTTNGTLCNRMTVGSDGMNLTAVEAEVTCKFCVRMLNGIAYAKTLQRPSPPHLSERG